jgi:hypothetical protein
MKIPILLSALLLFFSATLGASAAPHKVKPVKAAPSGQFHDVPPNHWAAQAVETLRQKGIVRGYPPRAKGRAR